MKYHFKSIRFDFLVRFLFVKREKFPMKKILDLADKGKYDDDQTWSIHQSANRSIGQLVDPPVGQSVRQSVGRSASRPIGPSISWSIRQSANRSVNQLVDPPVGQSVRQLVGRFASLPIGPSVSWSNRQSANRSVDLDQANYCEKSLQSSHLRNETKFKNSRLSSLTMPETYNNTTNLQQKNRNISEWLKGLDGFNFIIPLISDSSVKDIDFE
ncbi:unnamed protein product [Dracunculus medinensis]|uniref:Uncharacterized protein n=1 Tax=Dracunculus medinensis TaxID=318479 RepID=A0A0N4UHM7_DRAME|nr:unnamed protein product [Dracunculus medinensis]